VQNLQGQHHSDADAALCSPLLRLDLRGTAMMVFAEVPGIIIATSLLLFLWWRNIERDQAQRIGSCEP